MPIEKVFFLWYYLQNINNINNLRDIDMTTFEYSDIENRELKKYDQVLYAVAKGDLKIGRVLKLLPENQGVEIMGKGNKRASVIKSPDTKIWLRRREYYKNHRNKSKA